MRKITLLLFAFLSSFLGYSQLALEGFEGATFPPTNWATFDTGVGGTVDWSTNVNSYQGALAAYMNRQNIGAGVTTEEHLATPSVFVQPNSEIRFFSRTFTAGNAGTLYQVKIKPVTAGAQNDPNGYILLQEYNEDQLSAVFNVYEEKVINVPVAYEGLNVYIAFVMKNTQTGTGLNGDRWLLDNVQMNEKCLDPTALASAPLSTSATLSWSGTGTTFEIEHLLATATPTGVATGTSSSNNFNQTGLSPNTNYCFYVRAICSASSSAWAGPFCYTTSTLPPVCGGNFVDPGGPTGNYANNLNVTTTICPDNSTDLVTVTFTSFATEACCDDLTVYAGTGTGGPVLGTFAGNAIPPEVTSAAPGQCLTFVFTSDGSVTAAGWIANVTCAPAPTCPKPTALVTSAVTSTNATLAFTNNSSATTFHVLALPCGSPAPDASTTGWVSTTNNPYTFTSLNPDTCYTLYVRAACSDTDISLWSVGVNITTQPTPPACGGTFTDPGGANGNYANGANVTTTICPTGTDLVTVSFTAFQLENNFDFLRVYDGPDASFPQIGNFTGNAIPNDITSSAPGGCLTFVFTSDGSVTGTGWIANVICGPAPTCPRPTALVTSTVTSTNATLGWTNNSTATTFNVLALPCGSPAPDATTPGWIATTNNPYTFTNLTADTCYTLYVRAVCSDTDSSLWSAGANITTQPTPPACGGIFTDPAGANANYANGTDYTVTICPTGPNDLVTVTFTQFDTETNWDGLYVFDGNSIAAPQIASANGAGFVPGGVPGSFWGTEIPGPFVSSIPGPNGCLTFRFRSDGSVNRPGWVANVTCSPAPTCPKPVQLTATSVTTSSALLGWTEVGSATAWEIIVVPFGSAPPTAGTPGIPTTANPYLVTGLTPGTAYTFYVRGICAANDISEWSSPFTFGSLPLNDDCAGATPAIVNQNLNCVQTTPGTLIGATGSLPPTTCPGAANDDVWFSFTATSVTHIISFNNLVPANTDLEYAIFTGTDCGTLTEVGCNTAANLIPGNVYYVRVYSNSTLPQFANFNLCIGTLPCTEAPAFCTGQTVTYQNSTNIPSLGQIGCLFTSPNPAFFFLQVNQAGPLSYLISQVDNNGTPRDVDYVAWGPFTDLSTACSGVPANPLPGILPALTPAQGCGPTLHACSYSAAPTEIMCIPNAQLCEVYVVMITNFSNQPGFVTFTQTNTGGGTTECFPINTFNYPLTSYCQDGTDPTPVLAPGASAGTYTATPSGLSIDSVTGTIDLSASAPGTYIVTSTTQTSTGGVCTNIPSIVTTRTVIITAPANATIAYPATTYCNNTNTPIDVTVTGTSGGTYSSTPSGLFISPINGSIIPGISAAGIYTVTYTVPAIGGCPAFSTTTQVEILQRPTVDFQPNITVCNNYTLPVLTVGNYFTETGGTGTQLNAGDVLTTSQTIYVFANNGICTDERMFTVTIEPTPQVEVLPNISQCSNYILPTLTVGNYFTGSGGTGTQLNAGDAISSSQTIYIYAQGTNPACFTESSFTVSLGTLEVTPPPTAAYCDSYTLPSLSIGNYFTGAGGSGTQLNAGDSITSTQLIYVYAVDGNCTDEDSFTVTINTTPQADTLANVSQCGNYILPALTTGNYFTGPGGTGTQLNSGDSISSTQTIYVYAQSATTPNCFTETSFEVTIGSLVVTAPTSGSYCGSYTLPTLALGNYFTGTGGTGTQLNAGDLITSTQLIYVYAVDGVCTDEDSFTVTINSVVADNPNDVFACDSYTLPALSSGNEYYTGPNGTGTLLPAGTVITSTQTIYVFAQSGTVPNCTAENDFVVTIYNTPVPDAPTDVVACNSYTLPTLTVGNYYTQSGGLGTQLAAGTVITSSQTVYVYAQSGSSPNCMAENSFTITINSITAQTLSNVTSCDSYTLPSLNANNSYFTGSGGTGTLLAAGSTITTSQTIYIYAQTGTTPNCTDESSFTVTIVPRPVVVPISSVTACDSYTLPALSVGNYFTQPNGGGTQLAVGSTVTSSQTIYVYAQSTLTGCDAQTSFEVTISESPVFTLDGDCIGPVFTLFVATGTIPANAEYQWFNGSTPLGSDATQVISSSGSYSCVISVPNPSGACSTESFYQAVDVLCIIPKGISPNGDGDNDTFNLTGFNVTQLNIYNRYGTIVYSKGNYVNEWDGKSDNGNELPDGTYYYVIERSNGEAKSGWVYINRNAN
ncbi:fibronectin type III domain-containing protein [Flavobacterium sp.]|uniref:fibronectin type III domain-containing protein n=1 Tax=Flavobacterium sp. TaxID=239 RepID=UPI002B4B88CE|nr:gliding motility-associated C-terminal domain-containing protein [Flavobacterium sp.]HLP63230.1 gliding motility-associated C-terminal domain-containing protein [Flavobacterium sp.]